MLLTAAQVAEHLGISTRKVYDLHDCGALAGFRFGRTVRFEPSAVQEYIDSCRSIARKTQQAALASSLNSAAVSMGLDDGLESSFRRHGVVLKQTRSIEKNQPASTANSPASSKRPTRSAKLSVITSTSASRT